MPSSNVILINGRPDVSADSVLVPGTSVPNTFGDRFSTPWNVLDFGADRFGVADSLAAFQAAATAAGTGKSRVVYIPRGTYLFSNTLAITAANGPVFFQGEGAASIAYNGYVASGGTILKWNGGGANFITFTGMNDGGSGMADLTINANATALVALLIDGCTGFTATNLTLLDAVNDVLNLACSTIGQTTSWNRFESLHVQAAANGHSLIWLTGTPPNGNTCHNTFLNLKLIHGGTRHAIVAGYSDNNYFGMTYIFRNGGGTGNGVFNDITESANFPSNNAFFLLEAGPGGWYQSFPVAFSPGQIYDYALDNGQPVPTMNGGTNLLAITSYNTIAGVQEFGSTSGVAGNMKLNGNFPAAATWAVVLPQAEPDNNYQVHVSPAGPIGAWWITNKVAAGFTLNVPVALGGPVNCDVFILR